MESKEVQKLGLLAVRENVTVKSLKEGSETAPCPHPYPPQLSLRKYAQYLKVLGTLWHIPVRLLRSQRPSGSKLDCF